MFDVGWSELLCLGVVTLVFVGPKELPSVLRFVGRWVRKLKGIVADFRYYVDQATGDIAEDPLLSSEDKSALKSKMADAKPTAKKSA